MKWLKRTYHFILFLGFYLWKLIIANLLIAYDILTPRMRFNPGMIELNLAPLSKFGLLLISNLVSMTPGTLSTDLDLERRKLIVHVLYLNRRKETEQEIYEIIKRVGRITN
jgi:multicomponent Na+:H+ antiporter subunit E